MCETCQNSFLREEQEDYKVQTDSNYAPCSDYHVAFTSLSAFTVFSQHYTFRICHYRFANGSYQGKEGSGMMDINLINHPSTWEISPSLRSMTVFVPISPEHVLALKTPDGVYAGLFIRPVPCPISA